jgi:hypothetical protein
MASTGYKTLNDGTQAAAGTAAALNAGVSLHCNSVLIQNDPGSSDNVKVGNATTQSIVLIPGAAEVIAVDDVATIFVEYATGGSATVNWHAI